MSASDDLQNTRSAEWRRAGEAIVGSFRRAVEESVSAPLEPILHASPRRLKLLGVFTLVGHPLFYWLWHVVWPQPYENLLLRLATALLGVPLLLTAVASNPTSLLTRKTFAVVSFVQLPLLFSWMYQMNGHSTIWLATLCTGVLIYFHLTDWRIAAVGSVIGCVLGQLNAPHMPPGEHVVVLAFGWTAGLLLGLSGANLRRERLAHTLATIGIMAHELRTPLATTTLLGEALRQEARRPSPGPRPHQLERLADRLLALTRSMNHHIDMEIANARLLHLPKPVDEIIGAAEMVRAVVEQYPFRSTHERQSVQINEQGNFRFRGSQRQFQQVMDNLIENAIRSLLTANSILRPGDLRIDVLVRGELGVIAVVDKGIGMDSTVQMRVFEPFFSTDHGIGHGLGLAFCRTVVQAAGGSIQVRSRPATGAAFILQLPVVLPHNGATAEYDVRQSWVPDSGSVH